MSRTALPFHCDDISALARSLEGQLAGRDSRPTHLELLNMLARAGGYRNFQHFRAQRAARERIESPPPAAAPEAFDAARAARVLRLFDPHGRLARWPTRRSQQELCLWVVWSKLPPRRVLSEKEVNALLNARHLFGDHALLRRWLCDYGMMSRTPDGSEYRRVEKRPPAEALELMRLTLRGDPGTVLPYP